MILYEATSPRILTGPRCGLPRESVALHFELAQPFELSPRRSRALAAPLEQRRLTHAVPPQQAATGTPDSASRRIPTTWLARIWDFRMTTSEPGAVYRLSTHGELMRATAQREIDCA